LTVYEKAEKVKDKKKKKKKGKKDAKTKKEIQVKKDNFFFEEVDDVVSKA